MGKQKNEMKTAYGWGRKIHISRRLFEKYLVQLGYLKENPEKIRSSDGLILTEEGSKHCILQNTVFVSKRLWDRDAFSDVLLSRARGSSVTYKCPKCNTSARDQQELKMGAESLYHCENCGGVFDYWIVEVSFADIA